MVHRDIKPENIYLTRSGQVKVLDFGIARLREVSAKSTATKTGMTMGTPAFMPPEQARGLWDEVDGRSDLWAVGATMFNLLSGQLIHDGRTPNEQLLSAMTKQAPALASVGPGTGRNVAHTVDRALAFERENRWPDAKRMQEAVRHAYHDRHGAPISTAPPLLVPETVPNRTLPSVAGSADPRAPRLPTTGQPVFHSNAPGGAARRRLPLAFLVAIALGSALVAVAIRALVVSSGAASSGVAQSAARPIETPPTAATVEAAHPPQPAAPLPPSIAVTALPVAPVATEALVSKSPATPRPAAGPAPSSAEHSTAHDPVPAPPSASSTVKATCDPPYVVDSSTGKKKWKAECL